MSELNPQQQAALRDLPGVDFALRHEAVRTAGEGLPHELQARVVRETLEDLRKRILSETKSNGASAPKQSDGEAADARAPSAGHLRNTAADSFATGSPREMALRRCSAALRRLRVPAIVPAINATGVIIHTGMGRSPLAAEALEAVERVSRGYSDVAVSRETGGRRKRSSGIEPLLRALIGCEAALVVNNNAAAVVLALNTFARDREVVVSRGQLVEIGGSFRLPDVMASAGAILREVGTTNRTRLADYEAAIGENTAALMRIHPSNYRITGFTESVGAADLAALAHRHDLLMLDDIGSGAIIDFSAFGLADEPTAQESIEAGADVVLFSGDKLLGGPQAGILAGSRAAIDACASNPLMRALRVDKMTLAALEATLRLYLDPENLSQKLPLLRMIQEPASAVRARAENLLRGLQQQNRAIEVELIDDVAYVGGGSLPDQTLPSSALIIRCGESRAEEIKRRLRQGDPAVFARAREGRLELDLRTVADEDVPALAAAVASAFSETGSDA